MPPKANEEEAYLGFPLRILEAQSLNLVPDNCHPDLKFYVVFLSKIQANFGLVEQTGILPLPLTSLPIHSLLINRIFDAVLYEDHTASLNKP